MWKHKRTISRVTRHLVSRIKDNARTLSTSSRITITTHVHTVNCANNQVRSRNPLSFRQSVRKHATNNNHDLATCALRYLCQTWPLPLWPNGEYGGRNYALIQTELYMFCNTRHSGRKFLGCVNIPSIYLAGIGRSVLIARAQCMVISKQNFHNKCNIIIVLVIFDHKETYE